MTMNLSTEKRPMKSTDTHGFTLVEIMFAVAGLSVLMLIFTSVYLDCYKVAFVSDERNQINRDIRMVTSELALYARASNYFKLYKSFASEDRDSGTDKILQGNSGDFLVLIYQGAADLEVLTAVRPTKRIVGYFRAPAVPGDPASFGPVRKFDIEIDEASQDLAIEELLPSAASMDSFPAVIEMSEGLSDGHLFYNFEGSSIMVNGKIIHGNDAKRVTDTYNFTISPRGQQG